MNKLKYSKPRRSIPLPPGSETALLSGRFGDWVYFVRNGQQYRRRYVVPTDRRTPGQLRTRATLAAAAKYWSHTEELTDQDRDAWEAAANHVQSHPRLDQSGPLTGQQYFVGRACLSPGKSPRAVALAPRDAVSRASKPAGTTDPQPPCTSDGRPTWTSAIRQAWKTALRGPQAARGQGLTGTTPEPRAYIARPTRGPGPAVAGSIRRGCQTLSITARPRAGAGGE